MLKRLKPIPSNRFTRILLVTMLLSTWILQIGCGSKKVSPAFDRTVQMPAIDSLIQRETEAGNLPGTVILVQHADSVWHHKAYGYAQKYDYELNPLKDPEVMTTAHLFDLASLTKVTGTTFGIMILTGRGKLRLDDPVHNWLPEFNRGEKKKITIRHLLTHTAGLSQWFPLYYKAADKNERYRAIANMPLQWPVGEGRHYSDLGFMLLGDIIERVSGQSLDQFLAEQLFEPLNLRHTTFKPLEKGYQKIAATSHGNPFEKHMIYDDSFGYMVDVDPDSWNGWRRYTLQGEVNDGNAWYANRGVAGHAGLFSTADDLQKLVDLLLDKGNHNGHQLIPTAVVDTFLTKDRYGNALGWAMDPKFISAEGAPEGTFGHTGFTGTNITVIPQYDLSVTLLTNRQHAGTQKNGYYYSLGSLRQQIINLVLEEVQKSETGGF